LIVQSCIVVEAAVATPLYVFYPRDIEGYALYFDVVRLASDREALAHAADLCKYDRACQTVEVWDGERLVQIYGRRNAAIRVDCGTTH
jgi:hypothetical protein